jgi:hypothetical protein
MNYSHDDTDRGLRVAVHVNETIIMVFASYWLTTQKPVDDFYSEAEIKGFNLSGGKINRFYNKHISLNNLFQIKSSKFKCRCSFILGWRSWKEI